MKPINPAAHEFFIANGYSYTHHKAVEHGDAESGPIGIDPAWDHYSCKEEEVVISEDGEAHLNPWGDDPMGDWHGNNI